MSKEEVRAVDFDPIIIPGNPTVVQVFVPDIFHWPVGDQEGVPADIDPAELMQVNPNDYTHQVFIEQRAQPFGQNPLVFTLPYGSTSGDRFLTVFSVVNKKYKPGKKKRSAVMLSHIASDNMGLTGSHKSKDEEKKH